MLIAVTTQTAILAYAVKPRTKALIMTFPFPFSTAYLAVGRPVDHTNLAGLLLLLMFANLVRWLHYRLRTNIIVAIVASAGAYIAVGYGLAALLPSSPTMFWITLAVVILTAAAVLVVQTHREEPGHRTQLPLYLKLPALAATVGTVIVAKQWLLGVITVFPMVGVIAAYEARHSLWTLSRQVPVVMLTLGPMMVAMLLVQSFVGRYWALAIGWGVFLSMMLILRSFGLSAAPATADSSDDKREQ
jgi:hypothetical protein